MSDPEIEKILSKLNEMPESAYKIAKATGITEQTILNYRNKKTIPTKANAKLLEYYFKDYEKEKYHNEYSDILIEAHDNLPITGCPLCAEKERTILAMSKTVDNSEVTITSLLDLVNVLKRELYDLRNK